jgi:hypothetical protein
LKIGLFSSLFQVVKRHKNRVCSVTATPSSRLCAPTRSSDLCAFACARAARYGRGGDGVHIEHHVMREARIARTLENHVMS